MKEHFLFQRLAIGGSCVALATYNKFNAASLNFINGIYDFDGHTFKQMLVNSPAPVATNSVKADLTEIGSGNGYTAGGNSLTISTAAVSGTTAKATVDSDVTITASGGSIGPFRYVVDYDDTPTAPADPLWCFWDYSSSITLAATETFTSDYDQSNGLFTLT